MYPKTSMMEAPMLKVVGKENIGDFVAPWIIGNQVAKEVVGLQMMMNVQEEKGHSLLVGAPGSAKTDFLLFTAANHPCAVKIGKSTTSAGLRGRIERDGLMPGVLHSNSGKIVCFDEIDKVAKEVRNTLLESMQERTVTVTGQSGTIERDSIVNVMAAANPSGGTWMGEPNLGQIPFDKILMSRFHIWVPFFDLPPDRYGDLGKSFYKRREDTGYVMREKLASVQHISHISVSEDQFEKIGNLVGRLKATNDLFGDYITGRTVEGAVSFCKAHARFRGNNAIDDSDINYVMDLYQRCIRCWMNF